MIAHELRYFLVAVQFLTRIPVKPFDGYDPVWLDRATKYFPLVGLIVGAIAGAVIVATSVVLPQPLPTLLGLCVGIAVTGAFHEDGLADTADGFGGGQTRAQRLEIMKDSRIGTYGTLVLIGAFALKASALQQIGPFQMVLALIAAHAAARLASVIVIRLSQYAGDAEAAKVKPLATGIGNGELMVAVLFGVLPGMLLLAPATLIIALAIAGGASALLMWFSHRLIGGYTGDVLGAVEQVFETMFLVAVAGVIAGPG